MPSVAAFLLLCLLVTRDTAEGHPSSHLRIKRAASFTKSGGDYHFSPQNAASAYSTSRSTSPLGRLTVMDFSVPELSATSSEKSNRDGMDTTGQPKPSVQPTSVQESGANVAPTTFPMTPTRTPEPNSDFATPFDFSSPVQDDSSGVSPQSTGSEDGRPTGIQFRRFNSDGSLAAMFATPTESPGPLPDPMGDFFENVGESSPPKTSEIEMDDVPEATEASDDVDGETSSNSQGKETSFGPVPELSPLVTPSPDILEEDEELPVESGDATENAVENPTESKPRQSVFVSGPTTASVIFNVGEPPQFSFSSVNDDKPVQENNDEPVEEKNDDDASTSGEEIASDDKNDEPVKDGNVSEEEVAIEETETSEDELIEASSEPELDIESGGDVAIGRLQPKSPGRPAPTNNVNPGKVSEVPTSDLPDVNSPSPTSGLSGEDSNAQEDPQPLDNSPQSISSSPTPPNLEGKENSANADKDMTESFAETSPVAVLSSVSDMSGNFEDPVDSTEPDFSAEPEASGEVPVPSGEPELLSVALVVRHPPSFGAQELAEEIRLNSNEFITPDEWEIVTIFQLSQLSKFAASNVSDSDVEKDASEDGFLSFEVLLETQCTAGVDCETKLEKNKEFIRDGRMDETLAAHDFSRVSVFLEGELIERSEPLGAIGTSGLGVGVIAGIAVGGIAVISLVVLVAVVAANMRNGSSTYSSDYDSELEFEDDVGPDHEFPLDQGSFMISNFGGTPRHSAAMIPWLNDSSAGSGMEYNSRSFISVDSMTPGDANRMSQYRFDETMSSASGSVVGEEVSQVAGPEESGSTVYAVQ